MNTKFSDKCLRGMAGAHAAMFTPFDRKGRVNGEAIDALIEVSGYYDKDSEHTLDNIMADIAKVARFLCSDGANMITGTAIPVDGGWTAN